MIGILIISGVHFGIVLVSLVLLFLFSRLSCGVCCGGKCEIKDNECKKK